MPSSYLFACKFRLLDNPKGGVIVGRDFADNPFELLFEQYDNTPVKEIEITGLDGSRVALWRDEDLWLQLAARDVLAALEQAVAALNTVPRCKIAPNFDPSRH